jgi:CheY-like chemotaxis protein
VRLPLVDSKTKTADDNRNQTDARPMKLAGVSILVVDDEFDSREVLAEILRQYGAQTRTAGSASEALSEIDRATPQVLLSDIGMPMVDGYELIRQIRQRIDEREMIAVALTGLGSGKDKERALADGFQQCIVKPVVPDKLVDAIERLLISRPRSAARK